VLGVATRVHVEDEAPCTVSLPAVGAEGDAEVSLADAGRAVSDRERSRQEPTAEHPVELGEPGRGAWCHKAGIVRAPYRPVKSRARRVRRATGAANFLRGR
jgi:hypothetical protein